MMTSLMYLISMSITLVTSEVLTRRVVLSPGNLELVWTPYQNHIILRVEARTLGYFALSFASVHGGGTQDALLGWTSEAEVLLQDGVVDREGRILADRVNDYELLEGARNESDFLSVTLQRRWSTCDDLEDLPLGSGSVLVSWALYPRAPDDLDRFQRLEDGERHGAQVIVFNAPPAPLVPNIGLHVWPVLMPRVQLSNSSGAFRWCAVFEAPEMRSRHWIIGYRAEVRHVEMIKQMALYECRTEYLEGDLSPGHSGRSCSEPINFPTACRYMVLVWTPGNDVTILPSDVGIPVGANYGGSDFYMLQVTYSLQDSTNEDSDSSGFQVLLTSKKPRHQAAMLEIGVSRHSLLILPPRQAAVSTRGWCRNTCLNKSVPGSGVTVVSVLLHAQAAAQRVILRHLHAGLAELTPLAIELGFQQDQQQVMILDPRVHVKMNDNLVLECQYNTQDRDRSTLGGFGPEDEMCVAYLLYYPRISLSSCHSQSSDNLINLLALKRVENSTQRVKDKLIDLTSIISREALQAIDWGSINMTNKIEDIKKELFQKSTIPHCLNAFGHPMANLKEVLEVYQDHLVPVNKVSRCGIWEKAMRQERQRSETTRCLVSTVIITINLVAIFSIY